MAKVETVKVTLTFSKLVKDGAKADFNFPEEMESTLVAVAQEMCPSDVIVELEGKNE